MLVSGLARTVTSTLEAVRDRVEQTASVLGRRGARAVGTLGDIGDDVLAFFREANAEKLICVFNFAQEERRWTLPPGTLIFEEFDIPERNAKLEDVQIHIPAGPRLGSTVIEAEGLRKGFGDKLLIEDLSFSLPPAGIVGVIGPNGAGKTTLFRLITGQETPDEGSITIGDTVSLSYVDQSRDHLDDEATVPAPPRL